MGEWQASFGLIGWLVPCFAAAAIGSLNPPDEWYGTLVKLPWKPPSQLFAPVCATLYVLMGMAV